MTKKRYRSWITGSLAALVAGYFSYAYLSSPEQAATSPPPPPPSVVQTAQNISDHYDAGRSRTLNDLISSLRQHRSQRGEYARSPVNEYSIEDTFPVDENENIDNLGDLFHNDCEGVCMYMRNSDNTVTKVKSNSVLAEPIRWYDEDNECAQLQGNNFWFYVDEQGIIRAWGVGKEGKAIPEKVYSACTENQP